MGKQKPKNQLNSYAQFSGVAIQMLAIITVGSFGGVKLDQVYPNNYNAFTLICSLASVGIAMYLVIKQVGNISKKQNQPDE